MTLSGHAAVAGSLSLVSPAGASSGVTINITGTGFDPVAANNEVVFRSESGAEKTARGSSIALVNSASGTRRLAVLVPSGVAVGRAGIRVVNTISQESSEGVSIDIVEIQLPDISSAARGTSNLQVRITGSANTRFAAGTTRATFGAGITVHSTEVQSSNSLVATISITSTATLGTRTVGVITNTQTAVVGGFNVTAAGTPTNSNPSITSTPNVSATQGQPYAYDVNASDPDAGDSLSYSLATHPSGMTIDPATGLIAWTPGPSHVPSVQVVVQAVDGKGGSASQNFTINVALPPNEHPSLTSSPITTATEGQPYTYDVNASDADAGDVLTYSLTTAPSGMTIDPSSGVIQWTPAAAHVPSVQVVVRVLDGRGGTAAQSFTIDVTAAPPPNQQPVITSTPVTSATEGQPYSYDVNANDPDADTLNYTLTQAPAGMTVNASTGVISWLPAPTPAIVPVIVVVSDGRTGTATQSFTIAVAPAALGRGVIAGWVFDDGTGLPIQNATAQVLESSGVPAPVLPVSSDAFGRYRLSVPAGPARVRITKDGFTAADLIVTVLDGRRVEPDDARLTMVNPATPVVSSVAGGVVTHGGARLSFAPGSLTDDRLVRLTDVGVQGAIRRLPLAWNPSAFVDVSAGAAAFAANAQLSVRVTPLPPSGRDITLAKWDPESGSWMVLGTATRSSDGTSLEGEIPGPGQYAFTAADLPPNAPPVPQPGSTLTGLSPRPPPALTLTLNPAPRILFAQSGARSVVAATATPTEPLPSGTPLEIDLTESFTFANGSALRPMPGRRRLGLYGIADGQSTTLRAAFGVAPSRVLTPFSLREGAIDLAGKLPADPYAPRGRVLGGQGGEFTAPTGERVIVPPGSSAEDLPVDLRRITSEDFPVPVPSGLTLVRSFLLDLHGAPLTRDLQVFLPSTGPVPAGAAAMVVQLVDIGDATRLVLVAMAVSQADGLTTTVDPLGDGTVHLPGVRSEGRYAVFLVTGNFGYVTGEVTNADGVLGGALVEGITVPVAAMSDATGRYTLLLPAGPIDVRATNPANGDAAVVNAQVAGNFGVTNRQVPLGASPPVIVSVTPGNGATKVPLGSSVTVTFSEPVDPASVTSGVVVLTSNAGLVAGTLALAPGNSALTFRPAALLQSHTLYTLSVTANVRDTAGHALAVPFTAQFTTVDVTPPAPPPAGTVVASIPDTAGSTTITGTQGTVDPGGVVVIRNLRNNALTTLTPNADGSFSGVVSALRSDRLEMTIRDAAGNETTVPIAAFRNADGAVVVGAAGGRVEGAGGVVAEIPAGALPEGTVVRVVPVLASELPLPPPAGYPFSGAVRLELGGVTPLKEVDLSIPAPPGAAASDQVVVARPVQYRGANAWTVVERAHFNNGRYTTASPPFPGIFAEGTYTYFRYSDGCLSYVAVRVRLGFDAFAVVAGLPFVFPTFDVDQVVIPAPCGSSLNIQLTPPNLGELIQQISRVAPPTADDIAFDPQTLTDDSTAPVIAQVNNPTGQQTRRVELTFSELMDPASVCDGLTITDSSDQVVPGHVFGCPPSANAPPMLKAIFFPASPFEMGEKYKVVFNGAKDLAGNPLAAEPFIFTPFDPRSLSLLRENLDLRESLEKCAAGSCSTSTTDQAFIGRTLFIANGVRTAEERYTANPPRRLLAVDVSDPATPKLIGWHETTTNPRALAAVQGANLGVFQGDLLLVVGGGRVEGGELAGKLEIFDVRACTQRPAVSPNCLDTSPSPLKGAKFLSTPIGGTPRPGVPFESGVPQQITVLHERRLSPAEDTLIAYINVIPIGIEAVDVKNAFNAPFTGATDFAPSAVEYGDFVDVAVLRNRVLAVGPTLVGGEPGLRVFSAELHEVAFLPPPVPEGLVRFPGLARVGTATSVVIDVDGDGNLGTGEDQDDDPATAVQEIFDLAVVSSGPLSEGCVGPAPCGELYVIDLSSKTSLLHPGSPAVLARIPLPGPAFSVQVDGSAGVAYVEIRGRGLAVVDLTHLQRILSGESTPQGLWDANHDGVDDRLLRVIARTDIFATDLKVDLARGLAFVNGSGAGLQIVQVSTNCTELALDFKPKPAGAAPTLEQEKRILTGILNAAAERLLVEGGFNDVGMLEQGSGSCFWRSDFPKSCTSFIAGTSDHDIEVFVPQPFVAEAQGILDSFINSRPSGIEKLGALTLFAVAREPFEDAELLNGTPRNSSGDPSGDLAMGRQLLLLLWLLEGEYVAGHQGTLPPLSEILHRFQQKHTGPDPVFPGEPSGIPRLEGYEWSVLQEYNFYKSGAMVRFAGACGGDNDVWADVASDEATDPARNFAEDELRAGCQEELHLIAKGAIRSVLARLAAHDVANPTILAIGRDTYRKTACLTGVTDPRSPPADPNGYTEKACGSFEEYIASVAVRSVRAGHGVFQPADLPKIFTFYCAKVGENCANREGQRIVGPLFQTDAEANRFIADAIRFIELVQGQTFLIYDDTLANDTDPIGAIPFLNEIAGVCKAHGVVIAADGPRSDLRRCNRAIVQRKTNGNPQDDDPAKRLGARNFVKKNLRVRALNQGGRTVDVDVVMYEGDGVNRSAYTQKKKIALGTFGGGEIRFLDEEDDPDRPGRKRPVFPAPFDLTTLQPNAARAIVFFIDPDGKVPETNRHDNQAGFFYYQLDREHPEPPAVPETPEFPTEHTDHDPLCIEGPKVDFEIRAFGGSNTNLRGSREVSVEVGQTLQLMYRVRNVGSDALHNVSVRSVNGVVGDAVAEIAPGQDSVFWETFVPPPGTSVVRGSAVAFDADGNSLPPAVDAIRIAGHSPACEADIQSLEPDPNPFDAEGLPFSPVARGGSLFRYYKVVRNGLPAAGARVFIRVQRSNGTESIYISDTDENGLLTHVPLDGDTDPRGFKLEAALIGAPGDSAIVRLEEVEGAASTCPQTFSAQVTERDYSRSLKAGASLEIGGAIVGVTVKGKPGVGFEFETEGDTGGGDREALVTRNMGAELSAGLKLAAAKSRVKFGGTASVAEAELEATIKTALMLRDKHRFTLTNGELSSAQGLQVAQLVAGLLLSSSMVGAGPGGPLLSIVVNELNERLTGLSDIRESVGGSVAYGTHLEGTATGPTLSFKKTGIPLLKKVGFTMGAEGSADVYASLTLDLMTTLDAASFAAEYRQEFDLSAKLDLSLLKFGQNVQTKDVMAKGVKALQNILNASGGAAGSIEVTLLVGINPVELKSIEIAISHKKKYGLTLLGDQLVDQGDDDMRTLTLTISDPSKFPGVLQRILTLRGMNLALSGIPAQIAFSPTNLANEIVQLIADCDGFEETIESGKSISFPIGLEKYLAGEGLEGTLELQLDSMLTRALTKGAVTARDMYKLESYPKDDPALPPGLGEDLVEYIEKAVEFAKSILTEGGRIVRAALALQGLKEIVGLRFSPSGADLEVDGAAEPVPFTIEMLGYKYRPLTQPIGDFIQDPADVEGAPDGPHYGVGGFFNFAPVERQLNAPARLTIYWEPHEIAGFDESTLAIYRWNRDRLDWDYVGGTVDSVADSVTATVNRLGLYTAAPPLPAGALTFTSTFERSGTETQPTTTATFVSAPVVLNTGTSVPDGTLFTVRVAIPSSSEIVPFGQVLTIDADPAVDGIQVPAQGGVVRFSAELPGTLGSVVVIANATRGTALGEQTVVYQRPQ